MYFKLSLYPQCEIVQIKIVVVAERKQASAQEIRSELQRFARARHAPGTDMRVVPRYHYLSGKKNDPENESVQLTLFMLVLMSKPSTKAVPPDMVSSPVNILNVVVFPAPLIPRRPKHSLMGIPRLKRSTATNGPRPGSQKTRYRCLHNISACCHRVSLIAIISVFW